MGSETHALPCPRRPEIQELDGSSQCPGLAGGKPGDAEEEEEEELEEDDDSLAAKSQDDTVSPTPEPQGAYEDEEDEELPASLAVGFEHTRRWGPASAGHVWAVSRARARAGRGPEHHEDDLAHKLPETHHPPAGCLHLGGGCLPHAGPGEAQPEEGGHGPAHLSRPPHTLPKTWGQSVGGRGTLPAEKELVALPHRLR